jgi:hypothetical protein
MAWRVFFFSRVYLFISFDSFLFDCRKAVTATMMARLPD